MKSHTFFVGRAVGFIIVFLLVVGYFIFRPHQVDTPVLPNYNPYQTTLAGVIECLPLQENATNDCDLGFKADTGGYYAIDFNRMTGEKPEIKEGIRFSASGEVTPVQALNSDHWQQYKDFVGIFSVFTDYTVIKPAASPSAPKESATGKCYIGGCSGEVCSGEEGVVSTCIYKSEFACYKTATCERQATGKCGWTETPELAQCLSAAGK